MTGRWFKMLAAHEHAEKNYRIANAARKFCESHREDFEQLATSDSVDVDHDFVALCRAVGMKEPDGATIKLSH